MAQAIMEPEKAFQIRNENMECVSKYGQLATNYEIGSTSNTNRDLANTINENLIQNQIQLEENNDMEHDWATVKRKRKTNSNLEIESIKKRRDIIDTPENQNKTLNSRQWEQESGTQINQNGNPNYLGFVETNTMKSVDELVIIIQPIGENALGFTRDPVGLAVGLKNSNFNNVSIKNRRVNSRANRVAIELEKEEEDKISELVKITEIGKWAVKCYRPNNTQRVYGVIKGIDQGVKIEDLMEEINVQDRTKISRMQRMPRFVNKNREESTAIKIEFVGTDLPDKIRIAYSVYKVFQYNPPPMRCYNCQRIGHQANNCSAKSRCLVCSGPHKKTGL